MYSNKEHPFKVPKEDIINNILAYKNRIILLDQSLHKMASKQFGPKYILL